MYSSDWTDYPWDLLNTTKIFLLYSMIPCLYICLNLLNSYYSLNYFLLQFKCWSSSPQYLRMWLYLEVEELQISLVKMRSYLSMAWSSTPTQLCVLKGRRFGVDVHTRERPYYDYGRGWGDTPTGQGMPRTARQPARARRKALDRSCYNSQKEPALTTPWSQTSGLLNRGQ